MAAVEWAKLLDFNSYNYIRRGQPTATIISATAESVVVDEFLFGMCLLCAQTSYNSGS